MNQKRIKNIKEEILSNNWATLKKVTYDWVKADGNIQTQVRESYDRGDGVTVLLINNKKRKLILTKQFRLPTYFNKNSDGMMIEACAGKIDDNEDPESCIRREIEEETGYRIQNIEKIFQAYMSPGSVTELIHFYMAHYSDEMRVSSGGGEDDEQEQIEVLEISFETAEEWLRNNTLCDGKTIMLLQHVLLHKII